MKLYRVLAVFLAVVAFCAVSCKKDEEVEEKPALDGTLYLSRRLPVYTHPGDTFHIRPYGVKVPSTGAAPGYFYYLSNDSSKRDTSDNWIVRIPDTLCSVTMYAYAFAEGYAVKSITTSTVIVSDAQDGTGSITGFSILPDDPYETAADGYRYYYTDIAGVKWMRRNLGDGPLGRGHRDSDAASHVFGRYYTWNEALEACPEDWTLPSLEDWDNMLSVYPAAANLMGDFKYNGNKMWEYWPAVEIDDASRLDVIPAGYATVSDGVYTYSGMNNYATFWTSDEDGSDPALAVVRYIYEDRNEIYSAAMSKDCFAASVRCIKKQ